jgi:hypothetical protein
MCAFNVNNSKNMNVVDVVINERKDHECGCCSNQRGKKGKFLLFGRGDDM